MMPAAAALAINQAVITNVTKSQYKPVAPVFAENSKLMIAIFF
jgi:hypothetical protein